MCLWCWGCSDALLITDYSTFGYVASGLSGIEPYMLNVAIRGPDPSYDWRKNKRPTCVAAFSEPCLVADVYRKVWCIFFAPSSNGVQSLRAVEKRQGFSVSFNDSLMSLMRLCSPSSMVVQCRDEKKEIAAWDDPLLTICPGVNRFLMVRKP